MPLGAQPSFSGDAKWISPPCEISVSLVARSLPRDKLANGRTGARNWLLVSFHFRSRSFFPNGANAEANFLFFGSHLDDLEVVLHARFKMQWLTVSVHRFRLVAQAFHTLGNLNKRSERGHAQHFAVDHVTDVMLLEERLPDIGLKLLHAQRQTTLVRFDGQHHRLHAIALLQHFR